MRRRMRKKENSGAPKWMVTYSDMVTLVLVFFILLFSMSQIDLHKFESITQSFQSRAVLDFLPSTVPADDEFPSNNGTGGSGVIADDEKEEPNLEDLMEYLEDWEKKAEVNNRLYTDVQDFLHTEELGDVISATQTDEGVILVLQDNILFDPGKAEILDSGRDFLNKVAHLINDITNIVRVEGHTDNRPMSSYRYPSNWELSGARAGSVVRYLIEEHGIDEERFLIAGYGETRPVAPNDTAENQSKNRRVEIVILNANSETKNQEDSNS